MQNEKAYLTVGRNIITSNSMLLPWEFEVKNNKKHIHKQKKGFRKPLLVANINGIAILIRWVWLKLGKLEG